MARRRAAVTCTLASTAARAGAPPGQCARARNSAASAHIMSADRRCTRGVSCCSGVSSLRSTCSASSTRPASRCSRYFCSSTTNFISWAREILPHFSILSQCQKPVLIDSETDKIKGRNGKLRLLFSKSAHNRNNLMSPNKRLKKIC